MTFRELTNKLWDSSSLRVKFVDCDMARQRKDLGTWSFTIFSRVPIIQNRNGLQRLLGRCCHKEEKNIHYKLISKYLATHPNYYEISSKLSKLGNIMRVEILTLYFSIKDDLKIFSETKMKNCSTITDLGYIVHISYTVNNKKTICIYTFFIVLDPVSHQSWSGI